VHRPVFAERPLELDLRGLGQVAMPTDDGLSPTTGRGPTLWGSAKHRGDDGEHLFFSTQSIETAGAGASEESPLT